MRPMCMRGLHTAGTQVREGRHTACSPRMRVVTSMKTDSQLRRADGGPLRVLVVDDEPTLTELLSMALRYEGWEVRAAGDGAAAVRAAREFRPDAVVLDVMLPDFDGLEVLRRLRT